MIKSKRSRYGPSSSSSSSSSILLPCEEEEVKKSLEKDLSSLASDLPQEVMVEIIRRLPLESLHRFKWVSKSGWLPLITREILPSLVPRSPIGFFDYITRFYSLPQQPPPPFDPTLRSLHPPSHLITAPLTDSCNGLLLYTPPGPSGHAFFLVCNPVTGSWTKIPATLPAHSILDFDPWASPRYKIVDIFFGGWSRRRRRRPVSLRVYDSITGRWWRRDFRGLVLHKYHSVGQYRTVLDGAAYILCYRRNCRVENCLIARFDGIRGANNDEANLEFIDLPRGFPLQMLPDSGSMCMATSGGKLFLANFNRNLLQLRVWSLLPLPLPRPRPRHDDDGAPRNKYEWVMEHEITLSTLSGGGGSRRDWKELRVVGFHPVAEAIFILQDQSLFMYDLQSARFVELISRVPEEVSLTMTLFPFSPCTLDPLENRNQQQH